MTKILLSDSGARNNKAIRCASQNGQLEVVQLLINDLRVDSSANDHEALILAFKNAGLIEVVQFLLIDIRVDPSAKNNLALRAASQNGHLKVVQLLLKDPRVN